MTIQDARVSAWASAWQSVELAQQIRQQAANPEQTDLREVDRLWRLYDNLIAEAKIMASLAAVSDATIGREAQGWMVERAQQAQTEAQQQQLVADALKSGREPAGANVVDIPKQPRKRAPAKKAVGRPRKRS